MADLSRHSKFTLSASGFRARFFAGVLLAIVLDPEVSAFQEVSEVSSGIVDEDRGDESVAEIFVSPAQLRLVHAKFDGNNDGKASIAEVLTYAKTIGVTLVKKHHDSQVDAFLADVDRDKDGKMSLDELIRDLQRQAVDIGYETAEEMKMIASRKKLEKIKFEAADADKNGVLDRSELLHFSHPHTHDGVFAATMREDLRQKDKNGDGKISRQEFWNFISSSPGEEGGDVEVSTKFEAHDDSEETHESPEEEDFRAIDSDGNGFLDLSEYGDWHSGKVQTEAELKKIFNLADKDGDHHITADELASAHPHIKDEPLGLLHEWVSHHEL